LGLIDKFDYWMFKVIYEQGSFALGDWFFPLITNIHKTFGFRILFGLSLIFWFYKEKKKAVVRFIFLALVIGATDQFMYKAIKVPVARPRPHHRPELNVKVKVPYGPKSFSFPSNHAANTAALSVGLGLYFPAARAFLVFWTLLISYSRVYIGVHFFVDIVAGMIFGFLFSYTLYYLARKMSWGKKYLL